MVVLRLNASGTLLSGIGKHETLSLNNMCSIFMHTIFNMFKINSCFPIHLKSSVQYELRIKSFRFMRYSHDLADLCRGSQRYEIKSPIGSSQNECFLLPQSSQSSFMSVDISHCVENCRKHTRLGTCSVAESETFLS